MLGHLWSSLPTVITTLSAAAVSGSLVLAVWSARSSWIRTEMERRNAEVRRLLAEFQKHADVFSKIFDFSSVSDNDLRMARPFLFNPQEVRTRVLVDEAFEHLRDVHRSVSLGLIEPADLSFWTYWIHRIKTRTPLADYSTACGYDSFVAPLQAMTQDDPQLEELDAHCPWWRVEKREDARADIGREADGPV